MLTYHQVMTTDLSLLTTAAEQWDAAAKYFETVQQTYDSQVKSIGLDGTWTGEANNFARPTMQQTHDQYTAGAKEARAIASLLRDAHEQFVDLRNKLKSAVAEAEKADMKIDDNGRATWTKRNDPAVQHDPDAAAAIPKIEESWTRRIADAVRAVDDADQGAKLALQKAAPTPDILHGGSPGFNARAEGDIEKVEAREAVELATKLDSTGHLDAKEMAEFQRLFRDNHDDNEFSQTFLSGLGAQNSIKFTNKLNDLAYCDDKKSRDGYLTLERGMASTLATATSVPSFKAPDGKPLKYGSPEYAKSYQEWLKTPDAKFYSDWRNDLKKAGVEKFDLEAATEKTNVISIDHDQKVRGYQSLLKLMQQGNGYSPQFLADVTDDMIAAEKKDHKIWNLHGPFNGKNDGWFANDPVDAGLGLISRSPDAATAYLDPGTGKDAQHRSNDRLNYLLHDRDWKIVNNTTWSGNIEHHAGPTEDKDARVGLGAALEAASTGRDPGSPVGKLGPHSEGQARVMQDTISILDVDGKADSIPGNLQKPLGRALVHYVADTHNILDGQTSYKGSNAAGPYVSADNSHITNDQASLIRVLRGVSDDDATYATLYQAEHAYSAQIIAEGTHQGDTSNSIGDWEHRASRVGKVSGVYNAIGTDIILDKRDGEVGWVNDTARYSYHGAGVPITLIPIVGDEAQRAVDAATYEWSKDVINEKEAHARADNSRRYAEGLGGTYELVDRWADGRHAAGSTAVNRMKDEAEQSYTTGRDDAYTALRPQK
ncbi:hypothetical protein VR41_11810 [Streptomyces sp. NRRL B-1568]|nr:hypothetical protein VR41_11810 [Streptomyces sp. NRRL B-1568]